MNKLDFPDTTPSIPPNGAVKQTSIKDSFFRLIAFALASAVCAIVMFYTLSLAHNPKQVFPEGFGFVVGFGVLCGFFGVVEAGILLWRLGSHGFDWKK